MQIRKDIPSKMYHYTSLESLCSIVENQEFWLGDTRQMNDYNEARSKQNPDIFKGYLQDVLGKNGFSGVHIAVKPSACSLR